MGGSSAPSGETRYNWNEDMAPRWNSLLNTAPWASGAFTFTDGNVTGLKPREQYTGERFAPVAYDQRAAGTNIRALNDYSSNPVTSMNAARSQIEGTLGGQYLGEGPKGNPYMGAVTRRLESLHRGESVPRCEYLHGSQRLCRE